MFEIIALALLQFATLTGNPTTSSATLTSPTQQSSLGTGGGVGGWGDGHLAAGTGGGVGGWGDGHLLITGGGVGGWGDGH